jgi:carboxypeptidase family protein/TonB-dependent receptor-like protein
MRRLLCTVVAVFLLAPCAMLRAQTTTEGSILGTVKDSSGAVLPGAVVVVKNLDTGIVQQATTDTSGFFQVLPLPHGFYSVTVNFPGFVEWTLPSVELTVGAQKRIAPVLSIGRTNEQVTVEAGTALVQTEESTVQMNIEQKQIRDLPINGRDPVALVTLVPGMLYQGVNSAQDDHVVQGLGMRNEQTEFSVDGASSNDPSAEQGITLPNLDSVAQFSVETSNFSAADGRNPLQVKMVTKSGTNTFHGTGYEFLRSDAFDATNAFAPTKPYLRRNQFGYSVGGPIISHKTFFFSSLEHTRTRQQRIYNSLTIDPAFLNGDFSSLCSAFDANGTCQAGKGKQLTNPFSGKAFAFNQIPTSMFSSSSRFFFKNLLLPNAPGNRFQALAPVPNDIDNLVLRIDHQATSKQRIYGRWIRLGDDGTNTGYRPENVEQSTLVQNGGILHYDWTITPRALLSVQGQYLQSDNERVSPDLGKENLVADAGIQGIATAGREEAIGLPQVNITGYAGFSDFVQDPASFKRKIYGADAHLTLVRSDHTLSLGYGYSDRQTYTHHTSSAPRGLFTFNGQYTGDGFADYALGLVQFVQRNLPIRPFGMAHSPYTDVYVQDDWRATSSLTLNLGLRYDYWHARKFVNGCGATFDKGLGKIIAGERDNGQVDLSCQPTAPFLAQATAGEWIPASQVGAPPGLFKPNGYLSPRLGAAWRPFGHDDFVIRGGAGVFTSQYDGNVFGSSIIGPPYWADERVTFSKASLQNWATAWPADPSKFVAPSVSAAVWNVRPMKSYQWNLSVQRALPFLDSAVTVAYVGNRGRDLITREDLNVVPPGNYPNLQAALPYPLLGTIRIGYNNNRSWYDSLQVKLEKRFTKGLGYGVAYALSRDITDFGTNDVQTRPTPFAPAGYEHGPSDTGRRHVLRLSGIYDIPVGHDRQFAASMPAVVDAILGGWELSGIYSFVSGQPLTPIVPGATLGNGFNTHPDRVGDPNSGTCSNGAPVHTADCWFNDQAFAAPARYVFGNAGVGIIEGPAPQLLDAALMKNFSLGGQRLLQFRWEAFNALNRVNLGNPVVNIGLKTTGQITGAGTPRQMQFGLKFIF